MGEEDIETNVGEKTIDLTIVILLEYGSLNVLGFFFLIRCLKLCLIFKNLQLALLKFVCCE